MRLMRDSWRRRIGKGPEGGWEGDRLREVIYRSCVLANEIDLSPGSECSTNGHE